MIEVDELTDYLDEYLEEKQEVKNLTSETIQKQTFNISKFIECLIQQTFKGAADIGKMPLVIREEQVIILIYNGDLNGSGTDIYAEPENSFLHKTPHDKLT